MESKVVAPIACAAPTDVVMVFCEEIRNSVLTELCLTFFQMHLSGWQDSQKEKILA